MTFFIISTLFSVMFLDSRETEKNQEQNLKFGSVSHGTNPTLSVLKVSYMPRTPTFGNENHQSIVGSKTVGKLFTEPPYTYFFLSQNHA